MAGCQMIPFPKTENNDMPANILNLDAYKHKNSRPKFERKERPPVRVPNTRDFSMGRVVPGSDWELFAGFDVPKPPKPYQEPSTQPEKNYGADISTLIRLIEAGEL